MAFSAVIWFKCCDVLARCDMDAPCWVCGECSGVDYYETYSGAAINEMPYRTGTSTVHMQFTNLKP